MKIIDGKKISENILKDLKEEVESRKIKLCLGVVLVGDDPASQLYVNKKEEAASKIGIEVKKHLLSENSSEEEILEIINILNKDSQINGILVQMPLPKSVSSDTIIKSINLEKDVDGFLSDSKFSSPFIVAIKEALRSTKEDLKNKQAIALVNSDAFGQALKSKLNIDYRVWVVNALDNLTEFDVIITVLGQPNIIKNTMIKQNVILIDGGISKKNGRIVGDVDKESVENKASWLSPVPGGLGPMTVAFLLKNVVEATSGSYPDVKSG